MRKKSPENRSSGGPGGNVPDPRWKWLVFLGAVLLLKLAVLASFHDHPLLAPRGALDSAYYVRLASAVAGGDLALGSEPYAASPLYIYFLGLVFWVSGGSLLAAKLLQVVIGTAAVGLIAATARTWFGKRAAWVAGGLAAATGLFSFYEVTILQAALDPFLAALSLYLLARALLSGRAIRFFACGIAFGVFALNRPNVLLCLGAILLALFLTRRPRQAALSAGSLLAGTVLALSPVALRNLAVSGEPVLISSHGGLNFYIGNNPEADGTYTRVPGITPSIEGQVRDARRVAEAALGRSLSAREVSGYFSGEAWDWIGRNPRAALALFLRKVAYTANATDLSLNHSFPYFSRDERSVLALLLVGPWLLVPMGLAGMAIRIWKGPGRDFTTWASFTPAYIISVAAFFVSSRYRLPLLAPLCVGAAGFVEAIVEAVRARRKRLVLSYGGLLVLLGLPALWDFRLDDGRSNERTAMLLYLIDARKTQEALRMLPRVAREHPQPALLYFRTGLALYEKARFAEAANFHEKALAADPGQPEIQLALGQALLAAGRSRAALPHLQRAYAAGVRPSVSAYGVVRALVAEGRKEEARRLLGGLPPKAIEEASALFAFGSLALDLDDPIIAERFLKEAVRKEPGLAPAYDRLGLALALQKKTEEAIRALEEACRLDALNPASQLNLAVLYAETSRYREAEARLRVALDLKPGYPQAMQLLEHINRRSR